jgi:hypothetical protein
MVTLDSPTVHAATQRAMKTSKRWWLRRIKIVGKWYGGLTLLGSFLTTVGQLASKDARLAYLNEHVLPAVHGYVKGIVALAGPWLWLRDHVIGILPFAVSPPWRDAFVLCVPVWVLPITLLNRVKARISANATRATLTDLKHRLDEADANADPVRASELLAERLSTLGVLLPLLGRSVDYARGLRRGIPLDVATRYKSAALAQLAATRAYIDETWRAEIETANRHVVFHRRMGYAALVLLVIAAIGQYGAGHEFDAVVVVLHSLEAFGLLIAASFLFVLTTLGAGVLLWLALRAIDRTAVGSSLLNRLTWTYDRFAKLTYSAAQRGPSYPREATGPLCPAGASISLGAERTEIYLDHEHILPYSDFIELSVDTEGTALVDTTTGVRRLGIQLPEHVIQAFSSCSQLTFRLLKSGVPIDWTAVKVKIVSSRRIARLEAT